MAISEAKKKIVIDNYFRKECDVDTSIKEAFIKGFELGLKKAPIPQTEMEPCEDAISRQEVLDLINSDWKYMELEVPINSMQSVAPQPKIGKWVKSRDSYGNNHFTCPFCNHDIATKYAGTWDENYCSNCGARLEAAE